MAEWRQDSSLVHSQLRVRSVPCLSVISHRERVTNLLTERAVKGMCLMAMGSQSHICGRKVLL